MASEAQAPVRQKADYADGYWTADDGLRLHYRDYAGSGDKLPVMCIPGLARNARDFAHLAPLITPERRLILTELRGCGGSEHDRECDSYTVRQYVADILTLLDEQNIGRAVFIGTSLGGIVTMILAAKAPGRVAGAVLNDVGPRSERAGLDRIGETLGQGKSFPTWVHAARDLAALNRDIYPDYAMDNWIGFAKRIYRLRSNGRIKADYDQNIVEAFRVANREDSGDRLWPVLDSLARVPVTVLRGERSDLLSEATLREMRERLPKAKTVTVPRVGHPPALDEPEALQAIERLLARCD